MISFAQLAAWYRRFAGLPGMTRDSLIKPMISRMCKISPNESRPDRSGLACKPKLGLLASCNLRPYRTKEAGRLLRPYVWRRIKAALQAGTSNATVYLQDGQTSAEQPGTLG